MTMSSPQPTVTTDDTLNPDSEEWVDVAHFSTLSEAYDHGLVILAMGEACRVVDSEKIGDFELQAEVRPAPKISDELHAYRLELGEAVTDLPKSYPRASGSSGVWLCAIWVLTLVWIFRWQTLDPSLVRRAASSNLALLDHGEWWRPFTALFLHADFAHLAGNLASGVIFGALVSRAVGPIRAWLMILGCGAFGNFVTAWITYPQQFTSLGASTAVFASLGILAGLGISETFRDRVRLSWARIAAPVLAGLVLLGFLGGSHQAQTDVFGHVFGFSSGLVAGITVGSLQYQFRQDSRSVGTEA